MKRKVVGLALLASLIISVTSGCIVREDYYHRDHYHRDRDYNDHDRDHHDHDDHDYRGY